MAEIDNGGLSFISTIDNEQLDAALKETLRRVQGLSDGFVGVGDTVDNPDVIGEWLFSFDKKTIFNMFRDYPYKLTAKQKAIFDKENPYWANFFKDRE